MIDATLKNRLVGVAVLLTLAIVLLPALFDGANEQALLADTRMPLPPEVPAADELLAEPPSLVAEAGVEIDAAHALAEPEPPVAIAPGTPPDYAGPTVSEAEVGVTTTTIGQVARPESAVVSPRTPSVNVPPAPAPPAKDPRLDSLAEAWDVQVAALSTLESAEQLRAKLVAAGYKARVLAAGKLFRVVVGPELRRDDAARIRDKLAADARFGKVTGLLVRYVP